MTFFKKLNNAFIYLAEAVYSIFSPHDDVYPATGVQPYSGDPYSRRFEVWW